MVVTTTAEAGCVNLCDYKWWKTATDSDFRMEINPYLHNIKIHEADGGIPLHYAVQYGTPRNVKALLEAGASVNRENFQGDTALFMAAWGDTPTNLNLLIAAGSDVNHRNNENWTPLHYAARVGHPSVVKALLNAGAIVDSRSTDGTTPLLNSAFLFMFPQTLAALLEAGAAVNARDKGGMTALNLVISRSRTHDEKSKARTEEAILILLRNGANALSQNILGKAPWDYANSGNLENLIPTAYDEMFLTLIGNGKKP